MVALSRDSLHRAIDELPDERLGELSQFVAYLRYKEEHEMDWFYRLWSRFEPVREAAAGMSEDEINQTIAEAVNEVRRERKAESGL